MAGARLASEVRVGDLAADDPHEVAVPLAQRAVCLDRVLEAADPDHGQLDAPAYRRRDEERVAGTHGHRGLDREERRGRDADRRVEEVDLAGRLDERRDLDGLVDRGPVVDQLVAAEPDAEHRAVADGVADRLDQGEQETCPVLEWAAPAVVTVVRRCRQELADDRGVRALQLDAVEAALDAPRGNVGVARDDLCDLGLVHGLGDLSEQRVRDR